MAGRKSGFSVLELTIVLALMMATTTVAMIELLPGTRADSGLQQIQIQLRQARFSAIDQRRDYTVTFQGTNELVVVRQEIPSGTTTISDTFLPDGVSYMLFPGLPDTPDAFGNAYPVSFACTNNTVPCSIVFQSDGTVLANGTYVNGSVFIGTAGTPNTARAVTVMGSTGRIHGFRNAGAGWF